MVCVSELQWQFSRRKITQWMLLSSSLCTKLMQSGDSGLKEANMAELVEVSHKNSPKGINKVSFIAIIPCIEGWKNSKDQNILHTFLIKCNQLSFLYLRDHRMGTGGKGISVWVNIWNSKIEEEVGEKGPNVLCQEHLEIKQC